MFKYKKQDSILFKAIATALVFLFLVNDISFAADALAPTSKFNPIVTLNYNNGKYVVNEDPTEVAKLAKGLQGDTAFIYLNLLIGQFMNKLSELSRLGVSERGFHESVEDFKNRHLSSFISAIKKDLPHVNFDRFRFKEMSWDGNVLTLPYQRKDDASVIQILKYYLPGAKGDEKLSPDKALIPTGIGDSTAILEDPLEREAGGDFDVQQKLIIRKFEEEMGLKGKARRASQVIKTIRLGGDTPFYVIDDLEAVKSVVERRGEQRGRGHFKSKTAIFKIEAVEISSIASLFEYDNNLPFAEAGITTIPIGYILNRKDGRIYYVEEYISQSLKTIFAAAGKKERENLVCGLADLVLKMSEFEVEPDLFDLKEEHVRVRSNGEIVLTDMNFDRKDLPSMEDRVSYRGFSNIIAGLCNTDEEKSRLRKIFNERCGIEEEEDDETGWENSKLEEDDPYYLGFKVLMPEALHDALDSVITSKLGSCKKVLEVGSGTGFFYDFVNGGIKRKLTMLEQNKEYVEEAAERGRGIVGKNLFRGSATNMPFEDKAFDAVVGYSSFDAVDDLPKAVKEAMRVLQPGGVFVSFLDVKPDPDPILIYMKAKGFYRWEGDIIVSKEDAEYYRKVENRPDFWYARSEADIIKLKEALAKLRARKIKTKDYLALQNNLLCHDFLTKIFEERMAAELKNAGFDDIKISLSNGRARLNGTTWYKRIRDFINLVWSPGRNRWRDMMQALYDMENTLTSHIVTIQGGLQHENIIDENGAAITGMQVLVITAKKPLNPKNPVGEGARASSSGEKQTSKSRTASSQPAPAAAEATPGAGLSEVPALAHNGEHAGIVKVPASGIKKIILNGKPADMLKFSTFTERVKRRDAYIFTARIEGDTLIIGLMPKASKKGKDNHHLNITAPRLNESEIIGILDGTKEEVRLAAMFRHVPEDRTGLHNDCLRFVRFLIERGLPADFKIDDIPHADFKSIGFPTDIKTVSQFAAIADTQFGPNTVGAAQSTTWPYSGHSGDKRYRELLLKDASVDKDYFEELFRANAELIILSKKRMAAKGDREAYGKILGEIEEFIAGVEKIIDEYGGRKTKRLSVAGQKDYREEAKEHLRNGLRMIKSGQEQNANTAFLAALNDITKDRGDITDLRKNLSRGGSKAWKKGSKYYVANGRYKTIKGSKTTFVVSEKTPFALLWQAIASCYEEIDSELEDRIAAQHIIRRLNNSLEAMEEADTEKAIRFWGDILDDLGTRKQVEEKRLAVIAIGAAKGLLELGDENLAKSFINIAKKFFEIRAANCERIVRSIREGKLKDLEAILEKRNKDIIGIFINPISAAYQNGRLKEARALLSRATRQFMREPEFRTFIPLVWGCISNKKPDKETKFEMTELTSKLAWRVRASNTLMEFEKDFVDRYTKNAIADKIGLSELQIIKREAFADTFLDYTKKKGLIRGSPDLFWTMLYQSAFVSFSSPAFKAIDTLILIKMMKDFTVLCASAKFRSSHPETASALDNLALKGKSKFTSLLSEEKQAIIEALARDYNLNQADAGIVADSARSASPDEPRLYPGKDGATNMSFGDGVGLRHMQSDALVAIYPKTMIKEGPYYRIRQYEESCRRKMLDGTNAAKLKEAINLLKHKGGIYKERAERFETETTVIEIDIPIHFLLTGSGADGDIFYQLTHLGRTRRVIYIPKRALDNFNIMNIRDMMLLATILNHDQQELDELNDGKNSGITGTLAGIEKLMNEIHQTARQDDPFNAMPEIKSRIMEWFDRDSSMMNLVRRTAEGLVRQFTGLKKSINAKGDSTTQDEYGEIAFLALKIASAYDFLEEHKASLDYYRKAREYLAMLQFEHRGALPIMTQITMVSLLAKVGDYEKMKEEYLKLLKGDIGRPLEKPEAPLFEFQMSSVTRILDNISIILLRATQQKNDTEEEEGAFEALTYMKILTDAFIKGEREFTDETIARLMTKQPDLASSSTEEGAEKPLGVLLRYGRRASWRRSGHAARMKDRLPLRNEEPVEDILADHYAGEKPETHVEVIHRNRSLSDKPILAVFDIHGTLLEPTWKIVYKEAYKKLTGQYPSDGWMEENIIHKDNDEIFYALQDASGRKRKDVAKALTDATLYVEKNELPRPVPGALELVKRLRAEGVPIVIVTGSISGRKQAIRQLKNAGFLDYVDEKNVFAENNSQSVRYKRLILDALKADYPGHTMVFFDDGTEIAKYRDPEIIWFGIPQGKGREFDRNRQMLIESGADYILHNGYDWHGLDKMLTMVKPATHPASPDPAPGAAEERLKFGPLLERLKEKITPGEEREIFSSLILDSPHLRSLDEFISSDDTTHEHSKEIDARIKKIEKRLTLLFGNARQAAQVTGYIREYINIIYRWVPLDIFTGFYTDNCIEVGHALPHSLDVLERSIDILEAEKDNARSYENIDFEVLIAAILMHDLSQTVYRSNHHENSAIWLQAILEKEQKFDKTKIERIAQVSRGHRKISSKVQGRNERFAEERVLYDADMICAVSDLNRIYDTWVKWSEDEKSNKFYNPELSPDDRAGALRKVDYHYADSDGVANIAYQGWMQRNPQFCLTDGGKKIMETISREKRTVIDFIESKRRHLKTCPYFKLTDADVDKIIFDLDRMYNILFGNSTPTAADDPHVNTDSRTKRGEGFPTEKQAHPAAAEATVDFERERKTAEDFRNTIITRALEAKKEGQTIVLGLVESWIPNESRPQAIISELDRLPENLRQRGLGDSVAFVRGKDNDELAVNMEKAIGGKAIKSSNIIILGDKATLEFKKFKKLQADPQDSALLIEMNPQNLLPGPTGIRLLEFYLLAMRLNSMDIKDLSEENIRKKYEAFIKTLDTEFVEIALSPNGRIRSFIFTPIKPYDFSLNAKIQELQRKEIDTKA